MTISSEQSTVTMLGNGSTTVFSFPFVADSSSYIEVTYNPASGTPVILTPSQYTLYLNPVATGQIWSQGGTVTYPASGTPIATGTSLTISRVLPLQQLISISNQGDFSPQVIEEMGDTLEMQIQQVSARGGSYRGVWGTGITYNFGDIVQDGINGSNTYNLYVCAIANVSGTWANDLAAGDWVLAFSAASLNPSTGYLPLTGGTISGNLTVNGTFLGNAQTAINVKVYGATGNGTTDDTTAIQNALNALSATGGNVFFPKGSYKISLPLVPPAYVNLIGEGMEVSEIFTYSNISIINLTNENTYGMVVQGLHFYGNGMSSVSNGFYIDATTQLDAHMLIMNCRFEQFGYGIINGTNNYGLFDSSFIKCDFINCNIGCEVSGSQVIFYDTKFRSCNYGVLMNYESSGSIGGGRFFGCTWISNSYDVVFSGSTINPCLFSGCWAEQCVNATFGTLTAGTQYQKSLVCEGMNFQPSATAINGGILDLNSLTGSIKFDSCVVNTSLYSGATLPTSSDVRFSSTNTVYQRLNCHYENISGTVSVMPDSNSNTLVDFWGVYNSRKYTSDSAAGAAGLIQGQLYYNTTVGALSVKN